MEIDECKMGKRKYHKGRVVDGQWVLGGIERGTKNLFLVPVPNRTSRTLIPIIKERVAEGATIYTDCWRAYLALSSHGYTHRTVNHSRNFVDPDTGAHTQNIERLWRDIRCEVPRFGRKTEHFEGYLAEAQFKVMYRDPAECVHKFIEAISALYPPREYGPPQ